MILRLLINSKGTWLFIEISYLSKASRVLEFFVIFKFWMMVFKFQQLQQLAQQDTRFYALRFLYFKFLTTQNRVILVGCNLEESRKPFLVGKFFDAAPTNFPTYRTLQKHGKINFLALYFTSPVNQTDPKRNTIIRKF